VTNKCQVSFTPALFQRRAAATIEIDDAAIKQFVKANEFTGQAPPQHSLQ